jgi:hypothetical protein
MRLSCLALIISFLVSGCFGFSHETEKKDSSSLYVEPSEYRPQWTAIHPNTIRNILRDQLEIVGGVGEEDEILGTLNTNITVLGKGNLAENLPDSFSPEPAKFKVYSDIYQNACYVGLGKTSVVNRLFPTNSGTGTWDRDSFKNLYMTFLGRDPLPAEVDVLLALVNHSSLDSPRKDMTAACTVLLTSVEFSNSR